MSYAVVVIRRFNVKANGRAFNHELSLCLELPVRPIRDDFIDLGDDSGDVQIEKVTLRRQRGTALGFVRPALEARTRTEPAERLEMARKAGWVDVDDTSRTTVLT